jgi:hypothetical protein
MKVRLRPLAVSFWRWSTGPASIVAMLAVALYLLSVTAGPPLLALWLIGHAVLKSTSASGAYPLLAMQLVALAVGSHLVRRLLPPFRWRT